jgi:DNA-binding transcriptional LysR family regulator
MIDRISTLKLFVAAVEEGSIAAACRRFGISTTSGSRRIQELEAHLGVQLLDRTTRSLAPTQAGQHLAGALARSLSAIDAAMREAGEVTDEPSGLLRVLARRSFGMMHLSPFLPQFLAQHPKLTIDLELTEQVEIAPGDGVDLVIRLGAPVEKSLVAFPLASGTRILCASPQYLLQHGTPESIDALSAHACLTYRRAEERSIWVFERTENGSAIRLSIDVTGPLRATNGEVLCEAAIAGLGLVLLPAWMVAEDVARGRLVRCLANVRAWPAGFDTEIFAVYRKQNPLPAKISAFVSALLALEPEVALDLPANEYPD